MKVQYRDGSPSSLMIFVPPIVRSTGNLEKSLASSISNAQLSLIFWIVLWYPAEFTPRLSRSQVVLVSPKGPGKLHTQFFEVMSHLDNSEEWHLANTNGRPSRLLVVRLIFQIGVWAHESCEDSVDCRDEI